MTLLQRADGRKVDQMRPVSLVYGIYGNALGSVLISVGNTRVLCSVMVQDGVPQFLRGTGTGWLTAEYTMLPASSPDRVVREGSSGKRNSRSIEISRLIGRALRAIVDLQVLGERTIFIDCDVLQADGGTRTAAITGSYYALKHALVKSVFEKRSIPAKFFKDSVGAVSVGLRHGVPLLDIDCSEDVVIDADFNFVITGSGLIVEVQGAVEKVVGVSWHSIEQMHTLAIAGVAHMHEELELLIIPS